MNGLIDDRDDDVRLPVRESARRPTLREESHEAQDREFTLSTGTVLGIFFALALVCAVFFGFGYTMGRKSGQNSAEANAAALPAASEVAATKPAPGAPAIQVIPGYLSQSEADAANHGGASATSKATTVIVPTVTPVKPLRTLPTAVTTEDAAPTGGGAADRPATGTRPAVVVVPTVAPAAVPPAAGATSSYVQIAAVSHQEDADVLLSALKRRGYNVFARPGETDKLIHVQVGPFASKKDADAMRTKLMGDGYNAIVK